ncbi:MAG: TonB-dependent receptor [Prevotellaceae bacterium]|jgi:iron complex outermembrane receptor protein|nr:TonB-dependent receptor [Prevotellaceae bacterium]
MDKQRRNTKTKQLVMKVLENSNSALCHEEIEKRLTQKIDRVTIYRILQSFCDDGKVHKIIDKDGRTCYALCHNCTTGNHHDNHPHFHCIGCNTITCMEQPVVQQELPSGYRAISMSSYITGYCRKCSGMLKTLCLLVLFFAGQINGSAQTRIRVLDKEYNTPVAYANVYYPDTKTGTITDTLGQFNVNFSMPQVLVQISAIGYQTFFNRIHLNENEQVIYLQPSAHELQEVIVSGNISRLQGENVMNVEKLNITNGTVHGISLADKLASIAGIDNLSTGSGIGKPVIRGLSGNRIAVFSQGIRLENQQWGDEHGLGLDEYGYERVEIIKGPASLLYGSDALGGVLYFVDERYAKNNSIEAVLSSEFNSNSLGLRNNGAFKISKNRLHWNLFGGYNTYTDYKDGNNHFVPNSRFNTGNLKTVLGYTGNKFTSSLKYNFLKEKYGLTEAGEHEHEEDHEEEEEEHEHETEESYKNGRKPFLPYQDLTTHIISSENIFFFDNASKLKIDIGYVFNNRKEFEHEHEEADEHEHEEHERNEAEAHGHDEAALNMNLHTFSYNAKWYSPRWNDRWTLTAGSQGMAQKNANHGEEILIPDADTYDFGAFAMTDFYYAQKAYWQLGLRYDIRFISSEVFNKQYHSFNFSTGIYQPIARDFSFRLNLSSGFRAPNMYELLSNGIHHGTNRYEIGNPGLKTENSYQTDASLNYNAKHIEFFINPYFNYIRNYIYLEPAAGGIDNIPVFNYTQRDAFLYGGEAGFHLHPHPLDWLHVEGSYGSTFGQDTQQNELALTPSQKINAMVSANFLFKKTVRKFSAYLQNQYSFAQNRVAENELPTPGYDLLNAGIMFEFGIKSQLIQLNISANNLLNETYYDHLSRYKVHEIYNIGRSFNVKLVLLLSGNLK